MSEVSEDTQSACSSPTGCLHPGECAHGCRSAADELTRLGQEMESPQVTYLLKENERLEKAVTDLHDGLNALVKEALADRNGRRRAEGRVRELLEKLKAANAYIKELEGSA